MDLPEMPPRGISWRRYPTPCRANHEMRVFGVPTGFWVRDCGHQTALRPYYIELPSGRTMRRKFKFLDEAKATATELWKESSK